VDCESFQAELPDLIYGQLHPDAEDGVAAHLAGCANCTELTAELRAVRGAITQAPPPSLLGARIKLAARDELLSKRASPFARGGSFHLVAVVILAVCVGIAGFGLGIAYERVPERPTPPPDMGQPSLPLPDDPSDVGGAGPDWADPSPPADSGLGPVPRAPQAWQRVLFDAGSGKLEAQDFSDAREFFRRSAAVAPEGPLAAAARVGAAECSLRLGRLEEAGRILNEVEAGIRGGELHGGAHLLQRIHDLKQELRDE
jgi:hypothetical protein